MVVIAGEVGGRWSRETQPFVQCLAQHKATVGAENPPGERPASRALQTVEQSVVLFGSESVRNFAAGTTR